MEWEKNLRQRTSWGENEKERRKYDFFWICKERCVSALLCTKLNFFCDKWNRRHDHNKSFHIKIQPTFEWCTSVYRKQYKKYCPRDIVAAFLFVRRMCCFIPFQSSSKNNHTHTVWLFMVSNGWQKRAKMVQILYSDIECLQWWQRWKYIVWNRVRMTVSQFELMKNKKRVDIKTDGKNTRNQNKTKNRATIHNSIGE